MEAILVSGEAGDQRFVANDVGLQILMRQGDREAFEQLGVRFPNLTGLRDADEEGEPNDRNPMVAVNLFAADVLGVGEWEYAGDISRGSRRPRGGVLEERHPLGRPRRRTWALGLFLRRGGRRA